MRKYVEKWLTVTLARITMVNRFINTFNTLSDPSPEREEQNETDGVELELLTNIEEALSEYLDELA